MLRATEQGTKDIIRNATLQDIFPVFNKDSMLEAALEQEGIVIRYSKAKTHVEFARDDEGEEMAGEDSPSKMQIMEGEAILLWVRLIVERHGGDEKSYALLMAEVQADIRSRYEGRPTHSL